MPRRSVPLVTREYYHVFNRGVNKQPIFFNKWDYKRSIEMLKFYTNAKTPTKYSKFLQLNTDTRLKILNGFNNNTDKLVDVICLCLMPNHFHILIKQLQDGGISKFMGNFQNSLTRYINTKHERIGPLLQGEFKSVHVQDNSQLLHLTRYIHLNPYTSYMFKTFDELEKYQWSSFPEYIGKTKSQNYEKEMVLSQFQDPTLYKEFVYNTAEYQRQLKEIQHLTLE